VWYRLIGERLQLPSLVQALPGDTEVGKRGGLINVLFHDIYGLARYCYLSPGLPDVNEFSHALESS